ncbi:hypothetical protein MJO28_010853 [Puccinia striiformis f. sp. tritici]|uniref:Uncharacterized protein n=1 Tax=Puccinia striiformis f. sp. tritici TaxID=168172 RepID=A0ACC0E8V3_9BASI|nr:hypothetical protein MJO28_010853 [Puccinia striiformis f. sp. tritici]
MALAIYAHTTDETTAVTKLSIYEPGLISSLSELIKFEIGGDGLVGDTQAMRRKEFPVIVGRSLKSLVPSKFHSTSTLDLLVEAGVVPVIVDICENSHPNQIETVIRADTNLDGLPYRFTLAFGLFNQVDGLKVFVNRIEDEVGKAISEYHVDITSLSKPSNLLIDMLSHSSAGLPKALFRLIQRLLTSAGTLESSLSESPLVIDDITGVVETSCCFGVNLAVRGYKATTDHSRRLTRGLQSATIVRWGQISGDLKASLMLVLDLSQQLLNLNHLRSVFENQQRPIKLMIALKILPGFSEHMLAVFYQIQFTWSARLENDTNSTALAVLTLDLSLNHFPIIPIARPI